MNFLDNAILDTNKPEVTNEIINGAMYMNVPYIISEEDGVYKYIIFSMPRSEYNYDSLVSNIIDLHYRTREMFAIMNNYLTEPDNEKYKKEFDELQTVRKNAKEYVKKHFNF